MRYLDRGEIDASGSVRYLDRGEIDASASCVLLDWDTSVDETPPGLPKIRLEHVSIISGNIIA